jgi:hypothetical protein
MPIPTDIDLEHVVINGAEVRVYSNVRSGDAVLLVTAIKQDESGRRWLYLYDQQRDKHYTVPDEAWAGITPTTSQKKTAET